MEVTALCFRLLMLGFLMLETQVQSLYAQQSGAASLRITPDRLQFFQLESVSFHCEGTDSSAQLRRTRDDGKVTPACSMKKTSSGSSCNIDSTYQTESGEYWCETDRGERSSSINITITDGSVILESPALPVMEGDTVTLRCRDKTTSTNLKAVFYKDNVPVNNSPTQEIRMNNVSRFVEGLYKCSIQGVGESPESRLTVTAHSVSIVCPPAHKEHVSNDSDSMNLRSLQRIIIIVSTVALILLLLLLFLGFLHFSKRRVCSKMLRTSHSDVSISRVDDADDPNSLTYAVVRKKKKKKKDAADTGESLNVCTETNHSREEQTENEPGLSRSTFSQNLGAATESQVEVVYARVQNKPKQRDVGLKRENCLLKKK